MRNLESRVNRLEEGRRSESHPLTLFYCGVRTGPDQDKEANVFKFRPGCADGLVSYPDESKEEFEGRVRELTDKRIIIISAEYVAPEADQ